MKHFTIIGLCLLSAAWAVPSPASQKVSASYIIRNDAISNGGRTSSSASFKVTGVSRGLGAEISHGSLFVNTGGIWFVPSVQRLTLKFSGSGSGSVNSDPAGIACTNGSCSAFFDQGVKVTLMQLPDSDSTFSDWSNACSNTSGNCTVTMDGPKSVTATFTASPLLRLIGNTTANFALLQNAFNVAQHGNTIQARGVEFSENLTLNRPNVTVTLEGGYDSSFTSNTGVTRLRGTLAINSGTLILENLVIR